MIFAGAEIGGTKQQLCLIDEAGRILRRITERFPIPNGASDILQWMETKLNILLRDVPEIQALGVGFGGPLETATGRVLLSVQVKGWKDFALKQWFEQKIHLPTVVVNDTVAGGYAELMMGAGRNVQNMFYTNIGTGIGGALFLKRRPFDGIGYGGVYMGNTYVANPFGQPGETCRLEELCSGVAIEKWLRTPGVVHVESVLHEMCGGDPSGLTCHHLGKAAEMGDAEALRFLDAFAKPYGTAIANVITMLSPERVVIGGGVANLGERLLEPVRRVVERFVFVSAKGQYEIVPCELMDDNVILGAALFAKDGFNPI